MGNSTSIQTIFGEKKSVKQIIREQKRINNRSIRQLERELNRIKREEKKSQSEMKRLAKQGQMTAVRHLAKDIVRLRQTQSNFIKLKCELQSLSHQMDSMQANKQLMDSIKNVSKILPIVNKQMKLPELQRIMQKFDEEQMRNALQQEMIEDVMDDAFEHDSDEEDELVAKVLDEIGIEMSSGLESVPSKQLEKHKEEATDDDIDKDLQNRLNALKNQ
eukprot:CAMPEP_0197029612 /NCGR_PEP_ID=MMETSP1384-20130603/9026_1 /TAXON_ID=29189 /ORGANISM="Ammonia sp." /LENGTH=217 /DNA_ID=CAMNT_0042458815 /DNA_START=42 /DNA_END=695 /DNA_ORIENTATION=+